METENKGINRVRLKYLSEQTLDCAVGVPKQFLLVSALYILYKSVQQEKTWSTVNEHVFSYCLEKSPLIECLAHIAITQESGVRSPPRSPVSWIPHVWQPDVFVRRGLLLTVVKLCLQFSHLLWLPCEGDIALLDGQGSKPTPWRCQRDVWSTTGRPMDS